MIRVLAPLPSFWLEQQSGTCWWIIRRGGVLRVEIDGTVHEIGIPAGYRHNRASIPDVLEWIVSKDDCGTEAPPPHDGMYDEDGKLRFLAPALIRSTGQTASPDPLPWCSPRHVFTREEADEIFYQVMVMDTGREFKAKLAWLALRWFGRRW